MVVLSLDTTTRTGSVALWRDGVVIAERTGDRTTTHGQRLPRELVDLLAFCGVRLSDVDLFAVAAGPGSFTGLRVGIATIQGLAFATNKPVVGVGTLEALALAALQHYGPTKAGRSLLGAWMDAQRGEVFSALYAGDGCTLLDPPSVDAPRRTIERWRRRSETFTFIGDGAVRYGDVIEEMLAGRTRDVLTPPPLAGVIAEIAARCADAGEAGPPHAIKPVYVRRPDAELARDRAKPAP